MEIENNLPTDEDLAKQVQKGRLDSFTILVNRYEAKMIRYATKLVGQSSDIEDMVQEVFIKAYRNIQSFDVSRRFSPWLYRVAHNEIINIIKKRSKDPLPFFDPDTLFPHPIAPKNSEDDLERKQLKKLLDASLDELEPKYREPLILYYLEEMSYKDISDILHLPVGTVGIRIKRAKDQLKLLFQKKGYDYESIR